MKFAFETLNTLNKVLVCAYVCHVYDSLDKVH